MSRSIRFGGVALTALVAVGTVFASGSTASAGMLDTAQADEVSVSPEQMVDFGAYAKSQGMAVSDVVATYGGQNDFIDLVEDLRSSDDDSLVGAMWNHGQGTLYIQPWAEEDVSWLKTNSNVAVVALDQPGEKSQAKLVEDVSLVLEDAGQDEFSVGYDIEGQRFRLSPTGQ